MTFSVIKPKSIHPSIHKDPEIGHPQSPTTWGKRWKKTSPSKAPAEKLTINKTIFLSKDKRSHKATIPTKATILTIITLISAYQNAIEEVYKIK